jgi:hypothetical protein
MLPGSGHSGTSQFLAIEIPMVDIKRTFKTSINPAVDGDWKYVFIILSPVFKPTLELIDLERNEDFSLY